MNANLFIALSGSGASTPTDILFEDGRLGPNAAHTILLADSLRSGARNTIICPGNVNFDIQSTAINPINQGNTLAPLTDPTCTF